MAESDELSEFWAHWTQISRMCMILSSIQFSILMNSIMFFWLSDIITPRSICNWLVLSLHSYGFSYKVSMQHSFCRNFNCFIRIPGAIKPIYKSVQYANPDFISVSLILLYLTEVVHHTVKQNTWTYTFSNFLEVYLLKEREYFWSLRALYLSPYLRRIVLPIYSQILSPRYFSVSKKWIVFCASTHITISGKMLTLERE